MRPGAASCRTADPARHCCVLLRMPMQLVPPSSSHPLELWRVSVHFAPAFASRPSCVLVLVVLASWMLLPILAAAGLKPYIPGPQTMNRKPCTSCLALPCLALPCLGLPWLALPCLGYAFFLNVRVLRARRERGEAPVGGAAAACK